MYYAWLSPLHQIWRCDSPDWFIQNVTMQSASSRVTETAFFLKNVSKNALVSKILSLFG